MNTRHTRRFDAADPTAVLSALDEFLGSPEVDLAAVQELADEVGKRIEAATNKLGQVRPPKDDDDDTHTDSRNDDAGFEAMSKAVRESRERLHNAWKQQPRTPAPATRTDAKDDGFAEYERARNAMLQRSREAYKGNR